MMPTFRHHLRPGDLGAVVQLHGTLYARERGFDVTFEAYVAGPLAQYALHHSSRERLWLAERGDDLVGCVAVVAAAAAVAQLRWYVVHPAARGAGLGRRLLIEAVAFAREQGYHEVILWTESELTTAARLYRAAGFELVESLPPENLWGVEVVQEKYRLILQSEAHGQS